MDWPGRLFLVAALVLAAGCGSVAVSDEGTRGANDRSRAHMTEFIT